MISFSHHRQQLMGVTGVKFSWNGENWSLLGAAHTHPTGQGSWGNFSGVVCSPAIKALWRLHLPREGAPPQKELCGSQTDYVPLSFTPFRDRDPGTLTLTKTFLCRLGFSRVTGLLWLTSWLQNCCSQQQQCGTNLCLGMRPWGWEGQDQPHV